MDWLKDALADHVEVLYEALQEHESYEYMVRDGSDKVIYWGGEQAEALEVASSAHGGTVERCQVFRGEWEPFAGFHAGDDEES